MPEADISKAEKNYYLNVPQKAHSFSLKVPIRMTGEWKTVLAGYWSKVGKNGHACLWPRLFPGPATGLWRPDITILPLPRMPTRLCSRRGILRTIIPAASRKTPLWCVRAAGPSILKELSHEHIAVDIDDALRMNVSAWRFRCLWRGTWVTVGH